LLACDSRLGEYFPDGSDGSGEDRGLDKDNYGSQDIRSWTAQEQPTNQPQNWDLHENERCRRPRRRELLHVEFIQWSHFLPIAWNELPPLA
jgi:hypothetical protein